VATASITHDRIESKYRLSSARAAAVSRSLAAHVTEHHFTGKGGNRLPRARHYVTTIYFDTPSRTLYRAVRENDDSLKVRAREYYDRHPELLELATSARDIVRYQPVLWIEIKGKHAGRTYKRRIGIPKADVGAFFANGTVSPAMREIQRGRGDGGDDVIDEVLALREQHGETLRPSCLVNYRRTAFQNGDGTVRVTLDQRLAFFAPTEALWTPGQPLLRENLGTPAAEGRDCVLELKTTHGTPSWLEELLAASNAEPMLFSKFVTASEAVYGS
jgi:hypothetical protein